MRRGGPLTCLLRAAVAFADGRGIEALSMRNLAQELGVVPMALYKHVAGKEQLLEGMVDVVVGRSTPRSAPETGRQPSGSASSPPGRLCCGTRGPHASWSRAPVPPLPCWTT